MKKKGTKEDTLGTEVRGMDKDKSNSIKDMGSGSKGLFSIYEQNCSDTQRGPRAQLFVPIEDCEDKDLTTVLKVPAFTTNIVDPMEDTTEEREGE